MKFSNGTEFRVGTPKYSRIRSLLFSFGLAMIIIPKFPDWRILVGGILLVAGLIVLLIGTIAERREWQAKQQKDEKPVA